MIDVSPAIPVGRGRIDGGAQIVISVNSSWNVVNFRLPLIRALQRDGHSIRILAPYEVEAERFESLGCAFSPLVIDRKGLSPFRDFMLFWQFLRDFSRERPDIILSFTIKNNIFGALAARILGMNFIPNVTGLGTAFVSDTLVTRIVALLYGAAFRKVPLIFFQNSEDRQHLISLGVVRESQAIVIPGSGIDLERFDVRPTPNGDSVRFLMIGRMLRDKGVYEFVAAARKVRAVHPTARFQLLGFLDAENRSAIGQQDMSDWVREGVIEYLGSASDVRPAIAAANCVVLPSYREGLPRALLEAASMGRPVIASDVPGCREVVEDGRTGFLCRVRDADDLAMQIGRMIAVGHSRRQEMGWAGRRKVELEFDQDIVISAYRAALGRFSIGSRLEG